MTPEVRDQLITVIKASKVKLPEGHEVALADAIATGLGKRGVVIVDEDSVLGEPDEHLTTLKIIRKRVRESMEGDCPARDLAALSRRMQEVSREITSIEEKLRAEKRRGSGSNNGTGTSKATSASKLDF